MANPTTNYGWPMPTSTDLVTDLPADFAAFGQPVDTSLKALNPETTLGDISYRSATANTNTRLAIGSTGNVLTVSGGVPAWAAPAGGGKLLQVVFASTGTQVTVASTTYTDSNLTATITPTLATSKILVIYTQQIVAQRQAAAASGQVQLLRGATSIQDLLTCVDNSIGGGTSVYIQNSASAAYLDEPNTTSATTYKTQIRTTTTANSGQVIGQSGSNPGALSTIVLMEIGA